MTRQTATTKILLMITAIALALVMSSAASGATLSKIRVGQSPDKTRVVLEIKKNHRFEIQELQNPARLVVDFYKAKNEIAFRKKKLLDQRVKAIRVSNNKKRTRVVLDLREDFDYRYFTLGKNKRGAERVVIDVQLIQEKIAKNQKVKKSAPVKQLAKKTPAKTSKIKVAKIAVKKPVVKVAKKATVKPAIKTAVKLAKATKTPSKISKRVHKGRIALPKNHPVLNKHKALVEKDELVIAIDAGHGGKDSGAIGSRLKVQEKEVTLQLAKKLKKYIDRQPGMRAVLTREKDVFIPLVKRVRIANKKGADIFISLHADAFNQKQVRGGSVYVLSTNGASSVMARLLAKSENASLHDMKLKGHDSDVAFVLSDLSREANIRASRKLAKAVLGSMARKVKLHKKTVQSADFAVLKSIDMPSLLIETAFISNPTDEKNLRNREFQTRMAKSIVSGLKRFVNGNADQPRWGETLYVHYKVQKGDTLSEIASNYGISTKALKKMNKIRNANQLYVGKKLRIPVSEQLVASL